MEVEKSKEHQKPLAKRQNAVPLRESIIKARSQEVNTSGQRVSVEVSSDSEKVDTVIVPSTLPSERTNMEMM